MGEGGKMHAFIIKSARFLKRGEGARLCTISTSPDCETGLHDKVLTDQYDILSDNGYVPKLANNPKSLTK